jgi:hypothetical protein
MTGDQIYAAKVGRIIGFSALSVCAIGVAAYALVRYAPALSGSEVDAPPLANAADRPVILAVHAVSGSLALVVGVWQVATQLFTTLRSFHRPTGRFYAGLVAISGVSGFVLGLNAEGGMVGRLGFTSLGVVWCAATALGVWAVLHGKMQEHFEWMTRSLALCAAAITLRLQLGVTSLIGVEVDTVYPWIAWACWVPNLIIAEAWLRIWKRNR